VLANSSVLARLASKPQEQISQLINQLASAAPQHTLLVDVENKSKLFDQLASKF
jgi:hypothetical protein